MKLNAINIVIKISALRWAQAVSSWVFYYFNFSEIQINRKNYFIIIKQEATSAIPKWNAVSFL